MSWRQLGVQLEIEDHLLRIIEKDHPRDCEECCSKMLQQWLDSNSSASWEVLASAVNAMVDDAAASKK